MILEVAVMQVVALQFPEFLGRERTGLVMFIFL